MSIAVAGLGLFGTGVRGLAEVDGDLADAARERPAANEVKRELGGRGDCPWRHEASRSERRRL
ncbi:MAG: hypothetical protein ACRDL4_16405 [Thermoleophilaceae bacterium]